MRGERYRGKEFQYCCPGHSGFYHTCRNRAKWFRRLWKNLIRKEVNSYTMEKE